MIISTCPSCRGRKKIMGAGMIYHDCKTCGGIGHVKKEEQKDAEIVEIKPKRRNKDNNGEEKK